MLHPMGGVSANVSPTTSFGSRAAHPAAFVARSRTRYVPHWTTDPLIRPFWALNVAPLGKPPAVKVIGRRPATASVAARARRRE